MDDIKIHRHGGEDDDLARYTPEQLKEILAHRERDKRHRNRVSLILLGGIVLVAGVFLTPLVARLWMWGFA